MWLGKSSGLPNTFNQIPRYFFYDAHALSVKHTGLVSFDRWTYPFVQSPIWHAHRMSLFLLDSAVVKKLSLWKPIYTSKSWHVVEKHIKIEKEINSVY